MATYERRVDALGGVANNQSEGWNEGFGSALAEASSIAAEADEVIADLVGLIEDVLGGYTKLSTWVDQAEATVSRLKARTAR